MKNKPKRLTLIITAITVVALLATATYFGAKNGAIGKPGVDIEVITGAGGMPPGTSPGKILEGEQFTIVFTEPFSSLENWQDAKVLKEVSTNSGRTNLDLSPGKYGVYYVYRGQKILYDDLTLENPRNDIQRDKQGPWYIKVNILQRTKLNFSINRLPV